MDKSNLKTIPQDERWIAALCHASVIIPMQGLLVPIIVWATQQKRSKELRLQAIQAAIFQFIGIAGYMVAVGFYMIGIFTTLPLSIIIAGPSQSAEPGFPILMFVFVFFFMAALFIAGPIWMLIGLIGGGRTLAGYNFHYPLLGKWIEKRFIDNKETAQEDEQLPEKPNSTEEEAPS